MPVYAHCFSCGLDFESRVLRIGTVSKLEIVGVNEETCPRCGADARLMEGQFSASPQRTRVISAPRWSEELVERMQSQFREIDRVAYSRKYTDEEAKARIEELLREVESENPAVVAEYRKRADPSDRHTWSRSAKSVVAGLVALIAVTNDLGDFATRVEDAWKFFSARAGTSGAVEVHDPLPDDGWRLPERDA